MVRSSRYLNAGGQRAGTQIARQIDGFILAAEAGDAAGIFDLALDRGDADHLVVEHHGQLVVDVGFGVTAETLAGVRREGEIGLPSADIRPGLGRALRISWPLTTGFLPTRYHCSPSPLPRGLAFTSLVFERKNAALLRQRGISAGIRAFLHVVDFEHGRGADQFLDARRIVHAGQLHQDLVIGAGAAVLLHGFFGQTPSWSIRLPMVSMERCTVSASRAINSVGFSFI